MDLRKLLKKIISMSKRTMYAIVINCFIFSNLLAAGINAQKVQSVKDVRVNLQFRDAEVKDVFRAIERQTAFSFSYKEEDLKNNVKVNARYKRSSVADILMDLSKKSGLKFKQINEYIHVVLMTQQRTEERLEIIIQTRNVSGKVTDEESEGLPGVNVIEKTTGNGTVTNVNGEYSLSVNEDAIIVFSSVGYQSQEIEVGNRSVIDVKMTEDITQLQELVVTGYGSQVKRDVTGAISQVKAKDLKEFPSPSLDQQLQGKATGVQVSATNGLPSAPVRVMIRGTNSISSGTEPLWIIDGMVLSQAGELGGFSRNGSGAIGQNPLASINPNDIESIEILKDAAATAIYGSRGSNGVIIVTTKSGKNSNGQLNLDITQGITNVVRGPNEIGFVDGKTWIEIADEARANADLLPLEPNEFFNQGRDPSAELTKEQALNTNTNYFDEVLRQGSFTDLNLSTSNGSDIANYFISAQYRKDNSIIPNSKFERIGARINLDLKPVEHLTIGTRANFSYTLNERAPNGGGPGGNTNMATGGYNMANSGALPWIPIYHPTETDLNGDPVLFDPLSGRNVVASMNRDNYINDKTTYRGIGGLFLDYQLPFVKGLSFRSEFSFDIFQASNIEWGNTVIREDLDYAFDNSVTFQRLNYNFYGTYNATISQNHFLTITAGYENTSQQQRTRNLEVQGVLPAKEVGGSAEPSRITAGLGNEIYFRGYFGRLNYKLKDRYLFNVSFRYDGSSVFDGSVRWNLFPALSTGWIVSEEDFFNFGAIDFLKIRASWGQTGNSNISPNAKELVYQTWGRYGDVPAGDLLGNIPNETITWETTDAYDVGIDAEFFNNRISISAGYYLQDVSDMLLRQPVPQSSGIFSGSPTIWNNIGDMTNSGFEFTINTINIDKGNFRWSSNFNITTNQNEVDRLVGDDTDEIYNVRSNPLVTRVGERIGYFRLAEYAGIHPQGGYEMIYEMDLERFEETGERVRTGNTIPATRSNLQDHLFDFTEKSGLPTFFGGFTNNFSYKGIELVATFTFQGGNYIYDRSAASSTSAGGNILRSEIVNNTWTPDNTNAEYPQLMWNNRYDVINEDGTISENERFDNRRSGQVHDRFLQKGDFVRLRTLSLAYNLPSSLTSRLKMQNIRLFISANNLLTITGYEGYDPEVVNLGGAQSRNLGQGWVGVQLPQVRSFNVGGSFTF